jgi:hypothetical protein
MEIYTTQRPWAPLVAAPAQVAECLLIPGIAQASRVHQVQIQAELVPALATTGTNGSSGFTGGKGNHIPMRETDVRGVPPRGRPV